MIYNFSQGVNNLPAFIDTRYLVGISYDLGDDNKAYFYFAGGNVMTVKFTKQATDVIKDISEKIIDDVSKNNKTRILPI